ncbi:hypothetical protein WS69_24265 [Burkholderia sp. BDU5]|nr:hypothetical protein WS69_24265 [Burkholderia sp. BDU5]
MVRTSDALLVGATLHGRFGERDALASIAHRRITHRIGESANRQIESALPADPALRVDDDARAALPAPAKCVSKRAGVRGPLALTRRRRRRRTRRATILRRARDTV